MLCSEKEKVVLVNKWKKKGKRAQSMAQHISLSTGVRAKGLKQPRKPKGVPQGSSRADSSNEFSLLYFHYHCS